MLILVVAFSMPFALSLEPMLIKATHARAKSNGDVKV